MAKPTLPFRRLRLRVDAADFGNFVDQLNGNSPQIFKGNSVRFDAGLFLGVSRADPSATEQVIDLALTSLTLEVKTSAAASSNLMEKTVAVIDNTLDFDTWNDLSKQHASFEFSDSEANIAAGTHHLVISGITTAGKVITYGVSTLTVTEDGTPVEADDPEENPGSAISLSQADARYIRWLGSAVTGYTGGGSTNLDGIETVSLSVGILVSFVHATAGLRIYELLAGTDAEASPGVIRPDDYNASTNAKIWKSML